MNGIIESTKGVGEVRRLGEERSEREEGIIMGGLRFLGMWGLRYGEREVW